MASKQVRWECPNGCPAVLGPRRPKHENICRYCLTCSAARGRGQMVRRRAPAMEKLRQERIAKRRAKLIERSQRFEAREAAYYTVNGVNLMDKLVEFTRLPVFADLEGGSNVRRHVPRLTLRRCSARPRTRLGFCRYGMLAQISVNVWDGVTTTSLLETLLHELVHAHVGRTSSRSACHHGTRFKTVFRLASEQAFGVRPRLQTRYHGEVTKLVEQAAATSSESASSQSEQEEVSHG